MLNTWTAELNLLPTSFEWPLLWTPISLGALAVALFYVIDQIGEPHVSPLDVSLFLLWPTGLVCYLIRQGLRLDWPLHAVTELLGWSIVLVL
jgi:hypothetical protein